MSKIANSLAKLKQAIAAWERMEHDYAILEEMKLKSSLDPEIPPSRDRERPIVSFPRPARGKEPTRVGTTTMEIDLELLPDQVTNQLFNAVQNQLSERTADALHRIAEWAAAAAKAYDEASDRVADAEEATSGVGQFVDEEEEDDEG